MIKKIFCFIFTFLFAFSFLLSIPKPKKVKADTVSSLTLELMPITNVAFWFGSSYDTRYGPGLISATLEFRPYEINYLDVKLFSSVGTKTYTFSNNMSAGLTSDYLGSGITFNILSTFEFYGDIASDQVIITSYNIQYLPISSTDLPYSSTQSNVYASQHTWYLLNSSDYVQIVVPVYVPNSSVDQFLTGITYYYEFDATANQYLIDQARQQGYDKGKSDGESIGFTRGYNEGVSDAGEYTFIGLLDAVFYAPIKAVVSLFNFDLLGVNLLGFVQGILTLFIILAVVKLFIT